MLKTILFDLHGTLLPIDFDRFLYHYMKALAKHAAHVVPPDQLPQHVLASTMAMMNNTDPALTNAQVFATDFFPRVGLPEEELMPVFTEFYETKFPALREPAIEKPELARAVVQAVVNQGYDIALATNPVFPMAAIRDHMRWANIADLPWRLVTTYETMHACKPYSEYYLEVLQMLGRSPEECLMVGNDADEDGAAAKAGMKVFLITDFLINRSGRPVPPDCSGTLVEFLELINNGYLANLTGR